MDDILETKKRKINWGKIFLVVTIIVVFVLFIKPGIQGYGVYLEAKNSNHSVAELGQDLDSLQQKLQLAEQNLSLHTSFNSNVLQLVEKSNADLLECQTAKTKLLTEQSYAAELCDQRIQLLQKQLSEETNTEAELVNAELLKAREDLKTAQDKLNAAQVQLNKTDSDFNIFVGNMARSVCCKQKFDNPSINSYSVINSKLICLESGGKPISCSLG